MRIITSNHYGDILISDQEITVCIKKYLKSFLSFDLNFASINVIDFDVTFPVIQMILIAKNTNDFILDKLELISETTEMFLTNNLGIRVASVQVGVKYDEDVVDEDIGK